MIEVIIIEKGSKFGKLFTKINLLPNLVTSIYSEEFKNPYGHISDLIYT